MSTTSLLLVYFPWTCILFPTINHDSINARSPEVRVPMFSSPIYSFRKCLERMAHHSMMAPQYLHQLLLFGARDNIRHVNCTLHLLQLYTVWPLIYLWSQRHPQQHTKATSIHTTQRQRRFYFLSVEFSVIRGRRVFRNTQSYKV